MYISFPVLPRSDHINMCHGTLCDNFWKSEILFSNHKSTSLPPHPDSIPVPPLPEADLVPELEPPSTSLQAAIGSIFSQLVMKANTCDTSDMPTEAAVVPSQAMDKVGSIIIMRTTAADTESTMEMTAAELPIELGCGHQSKTGLKGYGAEWEGY
jgi:hypothetical protein